MGFIAALIYTVLSLSLGIFLIGASLSLINVSTIFTFLETEIFSNFSTKSILLGVGTTLILLYVRYIQATFRRFRRNKAITFESPQGNVSITLFAIEDMLKKMLEERNEISHIKPKVFLRKKWIELNAQGVLMAEVNLVELTGQIQEKIKEKMQTLLGEDKKVKVNLEIKKVALGASSPEEISESKIPFRNYE